MSDDDWSSGEDEGRKGKRGKRGKKGKGKASRSSEAKPPTSGGGGGGGGGKKNAKVGAAQLWRPRHVGVVFSRARKQQH